MITPFDNNQLASLDSGTILTDTINSRDVLKGIEIENFTPAFFEIVDDNNVVQVSIPPWSMKTSDLPKSQNFTLRTVSNAPVLTTNTVPSTAYRFGFLTYSYNVGLSTQTLLTLAVIGSNVTIGGGTVGIDTNANTIQLATGSTVGLAAGTVVTLPNGQEVTLTSGTSVGIDNSANTVMVGNDVSNPVNTQPVTGTPTASQYVGLLTIYQPLLTLNAVCQKLMISTNNSSSTTALDSDTAYVIGISHNGGSTMDLLWTFNVGSIPPMQGSLPTAGPYYEIDLSPGVYVGAVYGSVNYITSGSEPGAVVGAII